MIILVMGVSGSGKSSVGELLAKSLHWEFSDGDSFHPSANVDKMRHGIPLTDADRMPWLKDIQAAIKHWLQENKNCVLVCSALKESYRQMLLVDHEQMKLVYLKGSFELIKQRLQERSHHYMPLELLQSQFDTLEEPTDAIKVDISEPPEVLVQKIMASLGI